MPSPRVDTRWIAAAVAVAVAALTISPVGQALVQDAPTFQEIADRARSCSGKAVEPAQPSAKVEATLQALHGTYADLPRFVDVYHLSDRDPYIAVFQDTVPADARLRSTDAPVQLVALQAEPVPGPRSQEVPGITVPSPDGTLCNGIRPGTWADGCTANFVFEDTQGTRYIGSAGHCFFQGERVTFSPGSLHGTVVFRMAGGIGEDFALIEVDAEDQDAVTPEMCVFGGPSGTNAGDILGRAMATNGHGRGVGFPGDHLLPPRPRTGVGLAWGAQSFTWIGSMMGGDSGNPVTTREPAEAVGTHTHSLPGPDAIAWGTRWDHGMQEAEAALGLDLTLVTTQTVHVSPTI